MNRYTWIGCLLPAMILVFSAAHVGAEGVNARLIPTGSVELLADGKTVNTFKSEVPLPDGLLLVADGACLVQTGGIQLVARDKTVFAVVESAGRWNLTIKQGHVDFALRADAKPVTFITPHKTIDSRRAVVPASDAGPVRGYVEVTAQDTRFVVTDGSLPTSGTGAAALAPPGQGIVPAQATGGVAAVGGSAGAVGSDGGTFLGLSTPQLVVGGVATAGIITGVTVAATSSSGGERTRQVSPF